MADTIPAAKRAFLASQVRVLSAPLAEPDDWRASTRLAAGEEDLPDRAVQDALTKVNAAIRRHNSRAFPPAALAHVAAQIDALYLADAPAAQPAPAERAEPGVLQDGTVQRGADLTDTAVLAALPETWQEEDGEDAPAKRRKTGGESRVSALEAYSSGRDYAALRERLLELDGRRAALGRELVQAKKLGGLVAPLENPAETVQPNLVSAQGRGRAGELEVELERMKVLVERVGGVIDGLG